MKLNQVITGSALATALIAFAPVQSHASLVIENEVVFPISFKATAYALGDKNKIKKISISNKDILDYAGAPKGATLAIWDGDVVIISDKEIWEDLTTDEVLFVDTTEISHNTVDKSDGSSTYVETGTVEVGYFSDGDSGGIGDNEYGFDISGIYTYSDSESAVKNGSYTDSEKFSALNLGGEAYDIDYGYLPITAMVSGSGSGKLLAP